MTPKMSLRAIGVASTWSAVLAPIGYILVSLSSGTAIDLSFIPTLMVAGAVFGGTVALANEIVPCFLYMRAYFAIPVYIVLCNAIYISISSALGAPLLSNSMGDGMLGCTFFALLTGTILYISMHEVSTYPTYLFCGMIAGFTIHPLTAALGMVPTVNMKYCLTAAILGAAVGFIQGTSVEASLKKYRRERNR